MSCEAYGILISRWADGEATAEEARRVESHVAACPACRALAAEFRRNDGLVASAFGPETFGQRVATGVLGRLARREKLLPFDILMFEIVARAER
ncbi:MAG: zf-HC2 domain-containing protein [Candidatus Brocadiae bacterium]|nr:zf-HC2 domain-containing protein [Candidatus Brocadiia bacterium]